MKIKRENIFKKYEWLKEKQRPFIISADYDGIICSSFLSHYLNWNLVGYYNYESIWLSKEAEKNKSDIIWVDLNILPKTGKSIGGHIVSLEGELHPGFKTSCNPNIISGLTSKDFKNKYPFSTLLFLMWLHNIEYKKNDIGKMLIMHSDNTWMKIQKYSDNILFWNNMLSEFNWEKLLENIDSLDYESKVDQFLYPKLIQIGAVTKFSKLTSRYLNIKSREYIFNPDWDGDIILKLFDLFAIYLGWTPPTLPLISKRIDGKRYNAELSSVKKIGIKKFIQQKNIFSYAITHPKKINYTIFNSYHSRDK